MSSSGLRLVGVQILLGVVLFFAIDAALFRSGFWFRWVAPASGLGSVARALDNIQRLPAGKRGVVVMGDSRIGEGFSAKIATEAAAGSGLIFASGGVASSLPRVWYYLLRQTKNPAQRIDAVAIMLTSYHDDDREQQAERRGDVVFVHPLLRLTDIVDFPWTYLSWPAQLEAAESILFKGMFYKSDLQDFFTHPRTRIIDAEAWRKHGYEWALGYPGRDSAVTGMSMDLDSGAVAFDPAHPSTVPNTMDSYTQLLKQYRGRFPDQTYSTIYRREWLNRIADWCRDNGATLFVFRIPRGPLHFMVDADETASGVVAEMAAAKRITLLPAATFDGVEHPEYFFDDLHLNKAGRPIFSAELGRAIAQRLPAVK